MFNNKMTKQEVAKEFVDSFLSIHKQIGLEMAKECAIVAIDKIIKEMDDDTGLTVYPYHEVERETRLPLVRIEGLPTKVGLSEWEDALDNSLPECWVFVSCSSEVDYKRGWKTDSFVSMYAFRWHPGKWLGSRPAANIL